MSCLDCIGDFFSNYTIENIVDLLTDVDKKTRMHQIIMKYNVRDKQFLYFITLIYICLFTASLFSFGNLNTCESNRFVVQNLVLFSGGFSLFVCAFRVYFFKQYLQFPIIALFGQHVIEFQDIFMNVVFTFSSLCSIALYVAMFYEVAIGSSTKGIILMCVLFGFCILMTWWYKKIIYRLVRKVSETSNSNSVVAVAHAV